MDLHPSIASHRLALAVLVLNLVLAVPSITMADSLKDINFNGVNRKFAGTRLQQDTSTGHEYTDFAPKLVPGFFFSIL